MSKALEQERRDCYSMMTELRDKQDKWTDEDRTTWDNLNKRFDELSDELEAAKGDKSRPTQRDFDSEASTEAKVFRHGESLEEHYRDQFGTMEELPNLGDYALHLIGREPRKKSFRANLAEGADATGGVAVPVETSAQFIDLARANMVASQAGCRVVPVGTEVTHFPRLATDPVAAWRSEAGTINQSDPTFDKVTANAYSLACHVIASRELLQDASGMQSMVMRTLANAAAQKLDEAIFVGSGVAPEPEGIFNVTGVNEVEHDAALADYSSIVSALGLVEAANEVPGNALVTSPRVKTEMQNLQNVDNDPLGMPPVVANLRQLATTAIPTNLGAGTNESTIFVGDFSKVLLAIRENVRLYMLSELHAATGQLGFVVHARADVVVQRPAALAMVTGIQP